MGNKNSSGLNQPLLNSEGDKDTVSDIYKSIYKINKEDIKDLFMHINKPSQLESSLAKLRDHGYAEKIMSKLDSDQQTGIDGDIHDIKRRENRFGKNSKPLPQVASFMDSFCQTVKQLTFLILIVSAALSGTCAMFETGFINGIGEGLSIIISTLGLILITSLADWKKDKQYVALQGEILEENVTVIRGKLGSTFTSSVWNLVVGDVILLETGSRVPADCLILESIDLKVQEHEDFEENDLKKKKELNRNIDQSNQNYDCDPFLFMDSFIREGNCKALVCCVGSTSSRGNETKKLDLNSNTPLGNKLNNLEGQFMKFALMSSGMVLLVLIFRMFIEVAAVSGDENLPGAGGTILSKLTKHFNIFVVLIVVSVPEGLPLTIQISLGFSVFKMIEQKILVRELNAPEKMGSIEQICCGKTATLTQNVMKVNQFFCESRLIKNNRKDTLLKCELSQEALKRIKENILFNCEARVEMKGSKFVPVGNGTECGLLKLLQDADIPIHLLINLKLEREKGYEIKMRIPHTPEKKRSIIAIQCESRPGTVTVYVKGAPEYLVGNCNAMVSQNQNGIDLCKTPEIMQKINQMASQSLRVIGLAYTEMSRGEWDQMYENQDQGSARTFEERLEQGQQQLVWIGAFGLKDPMRDGVAKAISYARDQSGLAVTLVSGDHINTAKAVALQSGIFRPRDGDSSKFSVMTGEQFRQCNEPGSTIVTIDPVSNEPIKTRVDQYTFEYALQDIRVLSRATPSDKLLLIDGLKRLGRNVACTGEGINDVEALSLADIGLAMGSGCSAARSHADLVLLDDNFEATIEAIKWGRNIYINISRFLQFQVTVNISAVLTCLIGGIFIGESPLCAVQLLWINLIMDTFAAIALSTEPPLESVTKGMPYKENNPIITPFVWRQVIGVSAWNVIIMLIMFFAMVFDDKYVDSVPIGLTDQDNQYFESAQQKRQHLTKIFNVFVFLQLFNQINCRKVGNKDFNVLESFFHNPWYTVMLFGTAGAHIGLQFLLPGIFNYEPMDKSQWGGCIVVGSSNLLIGALLKLIKSKETKKLNGYMKKAVDEDKVETSAVVQTYKDYNQPQDVNFNVDVANIQDKLEKAKNYKQSKVTQKKGEDGDDGPEAYDSDEMFDKA